MALHNQSAGLSAHKLAAKELTADELTASFVEAARDCRDEEAEALCHLLTDANESALVALISSTENLDLRWWSIRGLAICGGHLAIGPLIHVLDDPEPELRSVAALTLGHIGRRLSNRALNEVSIDVDALLRGVARLLSDQKGTVRQAAADALILLNERAVATLQAVLANEVENARVRAAYALRKIGTQGNAVGAAAPVLFQILNDSNYLVHTYAHEALEEMGLLDNVLVVL